MKNIDLKICKQLERLDYPLDRLFDLNSDDLGKLINQSNKGNYLYNIIHSLPLLHLEENHFPIDRSLLQINLIIESQFNFDYKIHGNSQKYWIIIIFIV